MTWSRIQYVHWPMRTNRERSQCAPLRPRSSANMSLHHPSLLSPAEVLARTNPRRVFLRPSPPTIPAESRAPAVIPRNSSQDQMEHMVSRDLETRSHLLSR